MKLPNVIIKEHYRDNQSLIEVGVVILGNIMLALGVGLFILPQRILTGGVAGIAVALYPILHIQEEFMICLLTGSLFLIGSLFLGRSFLWKTIISTICYPLFLYFFTTVCDTSTICDDALLSSIYGGICMGIGVGLVFRCNASTGGMDIPPLILHRYTKLSLSFLVFVTDGVTVCLGAAIYGIKAALIGILSVWISSYMINQMMVLGNPQTKKVLIISDAYQQILECIHHDLQRGATLLEGIGSYTKTKRPIIMVCVSKRQFMQLSHLITELDKDAFVIVEDANEVKGYGFSFMEERSI